MHYLNDPTTTLVLQLHLLFSFIASAVTFAFYYSCAEHRCNPSFAGQLHCLSGMILCNRPLFSTLLCGLAGALLAALRPVDAVGTVLLLGMYWSLVVVVQYDVRAHAPAHFGALAAEMVFATAYISTSRGFDAPAALAYYALTGSFLLVMVVNFACLGWTPPFMTVQALVEIAWVCALGVCLGQMALEGW